MKDFQAFKRERNNTIKRIGYLYEKIIDEENIKTAILNASKKKRKRYDVQKVLNDIDDKTLEIQKMLIEKSYEVSPYTHKRVIDNSSGKERDIMRPKFYPDQCIQWALMQVIEPILLKGHYYHSSGSMPKKGGHFSKKYIKKWIKEDRRNTKYVLQIDITKYYPSINHDILKNQFKRKIKCQRTLDLIFEIINSGGECGLPIGNYTSQWFANFYLQEFDTFIKQNLGAKYYVRYMDDVVIFGSNKRKLHKKFKLIEKELTDLKLQIKSNWQIFPLDKRPLDFLGYKFYRDKITMRKRNSLRIKRRAKKIHKKEHLNYKDACAAVSYMGWLKHSNSHMYYNKNIRPYVNIGKAKEVIRLETQKQHKARESICRQNR